MDSQMSINIQLEMIDIHNQSWSSNYGINVLDMIQDKNLLKRKINALADRLFDGLQKGSQDFTSMICFEQENDEYLTLTVRDYIRFSFDTMQFEIYNQNFNNQNQNNRVDIQTEQQQKKKKEVRQNKQILQLCRFLQILDLILDGIDNDRFRSKREVFYQYQQLYGNQNQLDRILKRLSFLLQVPRRSLQFVSATKGLCAGAILLRNHKDNKELFVRQFSDSGKGLNISEFMDYWDETLITGEFILVVEKETMYFRILDEAQKEFLNQCALITGKGYPCLSTQGFLKLLSLQNPNKPIYYLGDLDPHGLDIFCQYAFSNQESMFERNNVPWVRWLGSSIRIPEGAVSSQLESREKMMLQNLLQREYFNPPILMTQGVGLIYAQLWQQWKRQMELLINLNVKFELESLIPTTELLTKVCIDCIVNFEKQFIQLIKTQS